MILHTRRLKRFHASTGSTSRIAAIPAWMARGSSTFASTPTQVHCSSTRCARAYCWKKPSLSQTLMVLAKRGLRRDEPLDPLAKALDDCWSRTDEWPELRP